jgi:hypothetical protein
VLTESHSPTRLAVTFDDDDRAVAGAGLALVVTLSKQLGSDAQANQLIDLGDRPRHDLPGRNVLTLVHAMVRGADCIDDRDVMRCGATGKLLAPGAMAPSTFGTFRHSFTFGHVRQLDPLCEELLTPAWGFRAGPGTAPMTIGIDYTLGGRAEVAECSYGDGHRLVVRRTRLPGKQAELFPSWRYHAFITDREGTAVHLEADHHRHALVELAIRVRRSLKPATWTLLDTD